MTRTVVLFDGRTFDTSNLTQEQELALLRRELGPRYAQLVQRVDHRWLAIAQPRKLDYD